MIITHNLAVVRHVSDEIAIMYMGRFVEQGPTAEIFANPAHPYTAGLIAAQPNPDPDQAAHRCRADWARSASLRNRPPGCEFHPRCPMAQDVCRSVEPTPSRRTPSRCIAATFPHRCGKR